MCKCHISFKKNCSVCTVLVNHQLIARRCIVEFSLIKFICFNIIMYCCLHTIYSTVPTCDKKSESILCEYE